MKRIKESHYYPAPPLSGVVYCFVPALTTTLGLSNAESIEVVSFKIISNEKTKKESNILEVGNFHCW